MVSLTCSVETHGGVSLVTARLEGGAVPQRVRLESRLAGPVWPPRSGGVPEAGWDEDGLETVVPARETVAVGYASPAPAADPPAEVADAAVVEESGPDGAAGSAEPTPGTALRELGDPAPPRDAVPDGPATSTADSGTDGTVPRRDPASEAPDAVAAWLDEVEARLADAERLASARSVPAATDALRDVGGLGAAEDAVDSLSADARRLSSVADRAEELAERADAVEVPVTAFRRLA